jgi:hypothetical protein
MFNKYSLKTYASSNKRNRSRVGLGFDDDVLFMQLQSNHVEAEPIPMIKLGNLECCNFINTKKGKLDLHIAITITIPRTSLMWEGQTALSKTGGEEVTNWEELTLPIPGYPDHPFRVCCNQDRRRRDTDTPTNHKHT